MATSGTTAFNPDIVELVEEAWEQAGKPSYTGNDYRTAVRSINQMTIEWANRGINLWTVDEGTISLVVGTTNYTLPADTIDLLEVVYRKTINGTNTDFALSRISVSTWSAIPTKATQSRPSQFWVHRKLTPEINVWPAPSEADTLVYWRLRRVEDAGDPTDTPDIPFRFIPAFTAGLAWRLAAKTPELAQRVQPLKAYYEEQFALAAEEDREKADLRIVPRIT